MLPFTKSELEAEHRYRVQERLGILCGSAEPTPEQLAIATMEADEWLFQARQQQTKPDPQQKLL
jgi:hypothetical protein